MRWKITCRAVEAATRPKFSGVSSHSSRTVPSELRSRAITATWPVRSSMITSESRTG